MEPPGSNPKPPEEINRPSSSPLGELLILFLGVGAVVIVLTGVLALFAGRLASLVPYRWEAALTAGFWPDGENRRPELEVWLQDLADELAAASKLPAGMAVTTHVIEQEAPNAFATLGGHVVVTSGLLEAVSSENALAMVLAHEIAHLEYRHPIQSLGRRAVINLVWASLFGDSGQVSMEGILGQAGLLTVLTFNRGMERQADRDALATLEAHYGHTAGAAEFFEKVQANADEAQWQALFRTHPLTADRIRAIRERGLPAPGAPLRPLPDFPAGGKPSGG